MRHDHFLCDHALVITALAQARFQFQFWRTNCNGSINSNWIEFSGAVLRASWKYTDMILLELLNPPGIGDLVNYAGWTRQTGAPANNTGFVIHCFNEWKRADHWSVEKWVEQL